MSDTDKERGPDREEGELAGEVPPDLQKTGQREDFAEREEDELERIKSRLAYLAAEFDNYRKRMVREQEAIVSFGNERILLSILPFLDNLERAISQSHASGTTEALLSGVQMTYDQVVVELRKFGLEQISAVGETFDPNLHEAIAKVVVAGKPEGTVLAEGRKGYLLSGRLLRPAQVTVAQGAAEAETPEGVEQGSADDEA
jgi:molecular chaperone GrpE